MTRTHPAAIPGQRVTLRPATMTDRQDIWAWSALSDAAAAMMGPPTFPDHLPPTWEEFCDDYVPHFFDDSAPELGRCFVILADGEAVGQVNYNDLFDHRGRLATEIDIWMRAEAYCGKGYGSDAVLTLCDYLTGAFGVTEFMMQPSARNPRAIHAYEKAGFARQDIAPEQTRAEWGGQDYHDSVFLVKRT